MAFGRLLLCICTKMPEPHSLNIMKAIDIISRSYSPDFRTVVSWLLSKPAAHKVHCIICGTDLG